MAKLQLSASSCDTSCFATLVSTKCAAAPRAGAGARPRFKNVVSPLMQSSSDGHDQFLRSSSRSLSFVQAADHRHFLQLVSDAFKAFSFAGTAAELQGYVVVEKEGRDDEDDDLGQHLSIKLISNKIGSDTRPQEASSLAMSLNKVLPGGDIEYKVKFLVKKDFGEPGAFIVRSQHQKPVLLKSLALGLLDGRTIVFSCDSSVSKLHQVVFFANKMCLPLDTPSGLVSLRKAELATIRGSGKGARVKGERIYDYDVYNDLGNPDSTPELLRPVLGASESFPYPRRCRTGRSPTKTDAEFESSPASEDDVYLPAGELPALSKAHCQSDDSITALYQLIPEILKAYASRPSFESLDEVKDLFISGFNLNPSGVDTSCVLKFPSPQVIQAQSDAWMMDTEFARQAIAGLNPIAIECLKIYPPRSRLDPLQESSLTEEDITCQLEGFTVQEALKSSRLFTLDYHDAYMPCLKKINLQEGVQAYASRTIFFLTNAGTLKPVAIELSLPSSEDESRAINRVFVPSNSDKKDWLWELAKLHVSTNDAAYHQAISHWLRTHAVLEPFVIATHRHLSDLHPVKALLLPHFKSTLGINSEARRLLVCAGGIIERAFFTGKYTLEISSLYYKNVWRFDEQGLPADLVKRGMAVRDPSSKHGLRLRIQDYPYAVDGLEIWTAIHSWVSDYVDIFYKYDVSVCADLELQNWWKEVTEVGHADKEVGWPKVSGKSALKDVLTTVIWLASAHHAAVNFGQYAYAGFTPNRPTITHNFIPEAGSDDYVDLMVDPGRFMCSTLANRMETVTLLCAIELLSSHLPGEEFLGERPDPRWTSDERVMDAFGRFSQRLQAVEEEIEARNTDPGLRNRRGPADVPFTLLCPSSEFGLTGRGVPNSVSI